MDEYRRIMRLENEVVKLKETYITQIVGLSKRAESAEAKLKEKNIMIDELLRVREQGCMCCEEKSRLAEAGKLIEKWRRIRRRSDRGYESESREECADDLEQVLSGSAKEEIKR